MMMEEEVHQFCLKWNNYQTSMMQSLQLLKISEDLVDVTLSCQGGSIRAHKIILSACSQYFKQIFKENPCQHPVVILKDVMFMDLESLVKYMYAGEVYIGQDQLGRFLKTAEALQVKGLAQTPLIQNPPNTDLCSAEGCVEDQEGSDEDDIKEDEHDDGHTDENEVQILPDTPSPPSITIPSSPTKLNHLLSLPPLMGGAPPTTPTSSLSPISLPSPGKVFCSPLKVPTPPNSSLSLKRSSLNSLAHYLSSIGTISPPSLCINNNNINAASNPKRARTDNMVTTTTLNGTGSPSPTRVVPTTPTTLPSSSPHYSSSSSGGEEQQSNSGADSDNEGLIIEEGQTEDHQPVRFLSHVLSGVGYVGGGTNLKQPHSIQSIQMTPSSTTSSDNNNILLTGETCEKDKVESTSITPTHPRNRWRCMQPRVCNYCWKTFSNSFNLKQHIVNVHVESQGVNCNVCQKVVKNKWYLRKHLVTAHGAPLKRSKNAGGPQPVGEIKDDANHNVYLTQ